MITDHVLRSNIRKLDLATHVEKLIATINMAWRNTGTDHE